MCRENTEGEYSGLEHEVVPGVVESLKVGRSARSPMRCASETGGSVEIPKCLPEGSCSDCSSPTQLTTRS